MVQVEIEDEERAHNIWLSEIEASRIPLHRIEDVGKFCFHVH